jgi:host factor-I protein
LISNVQPWRRQKKPVTRHCLFSSLPLSFESLMGDNKMASEKSRNLQEIFLNNVRKSHAAVTVFLVNGVKLQGIITWFDNFSILLKRDQHVQLVYKHAISTIMPVAPVQLQDFDNKDMGIEGE